MRLPLFAVLAASLLSTGCRGGMDDAELVPAPEEPQETVAVAEGSSGASSRGRSDPHSDYGYEDWHPEPAGGWCRIEGRHRHPYLLSEAEFPVQVIGGVVWFVGDALAWRWSGPVYWYYGHHRLAKGVWCLIDGPHTHVRKPMAEYKGYVLERGYYVWNGGWDADYTVSWKRYGVAWNNIIDVRMRAIPEHPYARWAAVAPPLAQRRNGRAGGSVRLVDPPARVTIPALLPSFGSGHGHAPGVQVGLDIPSRPGDGRDGDGREPRPGEGHSYQGGDHSDGRGPAGRDGRDGPDGQSGNHPQGQGQAGNHPQGQGQAGNHPQGQGQSGNHPQGQGQAGNPSQGQGQGKSSGASTGKDKDGKGSSGSKATSGEHRSEGKGKGAEAGRSSGKDGKGKSSGKGGKGDKGKDKDKE